MSGLFDVMDGLTHEQHAEVANTVWKMQREYQLEGMHEAFAWLVAKYPTDQLQEIVAYEDTRNTALGLALGQAAIDELARRNGHGDGETLTLATAKVVTLDRVEPEDVMWLWPGRIPLGKLTIIDGDPGLGKSLVSLDVAARLSAGKPMPDGAQPDIIGPASVVLLSVEDGLADTIRPRLDLAGAVTRNVAAITSVPDAKGNDRPLVLPDDWHHIEHVVNQHAARLIVLDPLMALLGGTVNSYNDQQVRLALTPGVQLAERTGAALVVIRHLTKADGGKAIYRGGGSIGITGAARSVLLVGKDPQDETEERRIIASVKSNLGARPRSIAYRIAGGIHPSVQWLGETDHTADSLVGIPTHESPERTEILTLLKATGEPMSPQDIADRLGKNINTVQTLIRKMHDDGKVLKPAYGKYSAAPVTSDTTVKSVTSVTTVKSSRPEPNQLFTDVTDVTDVTLVTPVTVVTDLVDGIRCRACGTALYTRESIDAGQCQRCRAAGAA